MAGVSAISADIPQADNTKSPAAILSRKFDIRRYCFPYFRCQLFKEGRFHLHTRVHDITFHNVSVFIDN